MSNDAFKIRSLTADVTVTMPLEAFERIKTEERTVGGTRGQRALIELLSEYRAGTIPREAIQQGGLDELAWMRLQNLLDALAPAPRVP